MGATRNIRKLVASVGILGIFLFVSQDSLAHCDTMDGPVITDAKQALEKGDITPVLKWVKPDAEPEIRGAFQKSLTVRGKGPEAKALADAYFFETLVRVHRAGEGAPYDGIKPAGTAVEPGIEAADKALESGAADDLVMELTNKVADGIRERFTHALDAKKHKDESVEAGREFVEAYVTFMHYVERLHQDATTNPAHHGGAAEAGHAEAGQHDEHAPAKTEHTHEHK
ncbi:MAG TPA: DUF6448 family protein [Candidatus Hydrogenedentes bacterium]|nr:DUF6448 family protein [Candidatus Hydrogenedentota bacterium]HQM50959.1 DUF6448 family protein [Candidatus Hydrogenedentota bacterium]